MSASNMNKPSQTDWERIDKLTDEEIDTSDIPPLDDSFFAKAKLRTTQPQVSIAMLSRLKRFPPSYLSEIAQHAEVLKGIINGRQWLNRFNELTLALERGCATYPQVEDHLFELKVISRLSISQDYEHIEYQPVGLEKTGKNCDLLARTREEGFLIELKTSHPEDKTAKIPLEHISDNHALIMDPGSYYQFQAVRGHLIDMVIEVEHKMENYPDEYIKIMGVYTDFHLRLESLRDFVAFYKTGKPHPLDPLGKMTAHELKKKNLSFQGTIDRFWAFPFEQCGFSLRGNESEVSLP